MEPKNLWQGEGEIAEGDIVHRDLAAQPLAPLALASLAAGADGLLIEMHPNPDQAKSDGAQSLWPA